MLPSRLTLILCAFFLLTSICPANPPGRSLPDTKVTQIVKIDSADVFLCRISGRTLTSGGYLSVRLRGIDLPEKDPKSKAFVKKAFKEGSVIRLTNIRLSKYYRAVADVSIDGKDLAEELNTNGFAKESDTTANSTKTKTATNPESKSSDINPKISKTSKSTKTAKTDSKTKKPARKTALGIDGKGFHPEMTFEEAIDKIRYSVDPPLPMVVLWPEIERNCLVDRDTPIGLDWNGKITIGQALRNVLRSVENKGAVPLQYSVEGGVVTIASQKTKLQKREMRTYNVAELMSATQMLNRGYGNQGYGSGGYNRNGNGYRSDRRNNSSRNNRRSGYRR